MADNLSRRGFLRRSTVAGAGLWAASRTGWSRGYALNEKLDIACVGSGGRGEGDIGGVASENIVALCDVDDDRAAGVFRRFSQAKKYRDFRKMLEKEEKSIDAVVVATPDHTHAVASVMAMRMGKHVYCEKPLTHNVYEARLMRETAAKHKVATQMGNQGTSTSGLRSGVDAIRAGVIGKVREVHVWTNRATTWWPQGVPAVLDHTGVKRALHGPLGGGVVSAAVRDTLAWDLWLGPAAERPYDPAYAPFKWRGWWDFGCGALGDMACHTMNLPYMALSLGAPRAVEAEVSYYNPETCPDWSIIRYEFPARGDLPPVTLTWYDGGKVPPSKLLRGAFMQTSGSLMIGEKGMLYSAGDIGEGWSLLPAKDFEGYHVTRTLPDSPGHHQEWIRACKGGPAAMSNFDYSGPLTEMVLLGNVAIRAGRRILWDPENLKIAGYPEANQFLTREYRQGWTL